MFLEELNSLEKQYRFCDSKWGFKTCMYWDINKKKKRFPKYVNPLKIMASWFYPNIGSPEGELLRVYWTTEKFCNCPDRKYRKRTCKHMTSIQKKLTVTKLLNKFLKIEYLVQTIHNFVGEY